ncbi:tyrosine protein phosphatase [Paludisphaera borealis]|uniref:Tyrosine specific protein phosphatases domain-containing protein n=1 Tax=Paludisphaera borealis TaxID=1387353 RepID=A0A1U7CJJ2_9BACT|nr:tyrosine protein phosphatase [Paludisphaera borealis]APW59110.1 hypothetical protein BSF38_00524 [Paludisphaera borealis]
MSTRRKWFRLALSIGLAALAAHLLWRHGHDYVFPNQFAEVVPGKIYRGAWQKEWPMRQIARDRKIKTILALAHPYDSAIAVKERALAKELGIRWVHVPIIDQRSEEQPKTIFELLDDAAAVLNDPANYPIFFHCHHGLNRVSMTQIAYRTKYCGWTLEQATDEVASSFGLVTVNHGPDFRTMTNYYDKCVLPFRESKAAEETAVAAEKSAELATKSVPAPRTAADQPAAMRR